MESEIKISRALLARVASYLENCNDRSIAGDAWQSDELMHDTALVNSLLARANEREANIVQGMAQTEIEESEFHGPK